MKYFFIFFSLFFVTTTFSLTQLDASVDKTSLSLHEPLRFSLVAEDEGGDISPDITPLLKDFKILSRGQSQQLIMNHQKTIQYTQWFFSLMPLHAGEITIPSFTLGNVSSHPITIKISETEQPLPQNNPSVFIRTSITPQSSYVQQQMIYSLRIYYRRSIQNPTLNMTNTEDYLMQHLAPDESYSKIIGGIAYQVIEQRYALFPQHSGTLKMPVPTLSGHIQEDAPADYWGMEDRFKLFTVSGKEKELNILPIPSQHSQDWWLPANKVTLTQSFSQPLETLTLGSPLTRTITLEVNGLLESQLPNLTFPSIEGLQIYPDKATTTQEITPSGIISKKTFKIAYIPNHPGIITLPPIHVTWWNGKTNQSEQAALASEKLNIIPQNLTNREISPTPPQPLQVSLDTPTHTTPSLLKSSSFTITPWFWISTSLLALWLITLFFLFIQRKKMRAPLRDKKNEYSLRKARNHLKKTCFSNHPKAAKTAFLNLAHALWPEESFLNLSQVKAKLSDETAIEAINTLEKVLYTPAKTPWNGAACWEAVKNRMVKPSHTEGEKTSSPPHLYLGDHHD